MIEVKLTGCFYESSSTIEVQGSRTKTYRYIREGYYMKEERNGYYLLIKPSKVLVLFETPNGVIKKNFKTEILKYYGKNRISEGIVEKFKKDAEDGKIIFSLEDAGYISIK